MSIATTALGALPVAHRARLLDAAHDVCRPRGTRLFEEGGHADRFWVVRTGTVALDLRVPGRAAPVVETLGHGELVGWSWLFPPYVWQLGAEVTNPMRAHEFDAVAVRALCAEDPALGAAVARWVGAVLARRLQAARTRLLDLYAPYGSGPAR